MALHQTKLLLWPSLLLVLTLLPAAAEAVPDSASAAFGVSAPPPPPPLASRRRTSHSDHIIAPRLPLFSSSPNVASEEAPELLRCEDVDGDSCQTLCNERNLPLEQVKNARDLASVRNSPVIPGRIFRTGRLGDATLQDRRILFGISDDNDKNENNAVECGIRTLVDLRSPTELKDDPALNNPDVFEDFVDFVWRERDNSVRQLAPGEAVVKPRRKKRSWSPSRKDSSSTYDGSASSSSRPPPSYTAEDVGPHRKERHFVSLMNEFKYVKGTVPRVAKRHLLKSALTSPGALVSRRARTSVKKPFLKIINKGGLSLLNELVLQHGAPGIRRVLDLCSDPQRHPIAFYCTAGKDRTGIIAAIILGLCGATPDDIVEDYTLSANVYVSSPYCSDKSRYKGASNLCIVLKFSRCTRVGVLLCMGACVCASTAVVWIWPD